MQHVFCIMSGMTKNLISKLLHFTFAAFSGPLAPLLFGWQ